MARMIRPRRTLLAATVALTTVCCLSGLASGVAAPVRAAVPLPRATAAAEATAPAGTNLLANGDAELGDSSYRGYDEVIVPGWKVTEGLPTVVRYGVKALLLKRSAGPADRGNSYFAGGSGGTGMLEQDVPLLAPSGTALAAGTTVTIQGWLGGLAASKDSPSVRLIFHGPAGVRLGDATLGPVTKHMRKNTTALVHITRSVHVPAGAASVSVSLVMATDATNYDGRDGSVPGNNQAWADNLSLTASVPVRAPAPLTPPTATVPAYDHVFVVMMENQDYANIIGNTRQAPYLNSLLPQSTNFGAMYAEVHPSDPNYLALSAGSTFHVMGDPIETNLDYTIDARNIGDLVQDAGKTWKAYYQSAHGPCDKTVHDPYYNDDLPFLYFKDIRDDAARCESHLVPLPQMATDLQSTTTTPNFVWWGADDCSDMEGCGIRAGDTFLKETIGDILASKAWTTQRSLLLVTFDEDRYDKERPAQLIPTIALASTGVKQGYLSKVRYDHYNMLRTIEGTLGLGTLTANDLYAEPMTDIFNSRGTVPTVVKPRRR
jgi:Phosphoesterase family